MKYSLVASLLASSTVVLGELVPVHFKAPSPAHFREVVRNDTYDFGESSEPMAWTNGMAD